jgi:hypothetical protein
MTDKKASHKQTSWWAPVWRGLVVDPDAKHYQKLRSAVWLFLYLLIHADRRSGRLYRKHETIAKHMGIKPRTIRNWLSILRKQGYVLIQNSGRSLSIDIQKWKPIVGQPGKTLPSRMAKP